jgi:hypothetical protein
MQASTLSIIESLKSKLLEYPALVDSLKNKDISFLPQLETWMLETETIFKKNNISRCSEIAGMRSRILAPVFSETQKRSKRKLQLQAASALMYDLQSTVLDVVSPLEAKANEARDLLVYLLNILKQSHALVFTDQTDFQSFINQVWQVFSTHEQLKATAIKILTLVPQNDALRIIAEEINLSEWR